MIDKAVLEALQAALATASSKAQGAGRRAQGAKAQGSRRREQGGMGSGGKSFGAFRSPAVQQVNDLVPCPLPLAPSPPAPCALRPAPSLAFFDLDGTMARGHMIFDFPAHLLEAGLFLPAAHARILEMQDGFRKKRLTYRDVAEELPRLYAEGVKGQRARVIALEAEKFVEHRMGNVFEYARPLVMLMREFGRPGLAISGSPVETVNALSRRLGMEAALGTVLETRAGLFTGKVLRNFILKETKRACFRELVKKLKLDASACFGFGDTEQDESFLSGVGHPVALNPTAELRTIALKKGWDVFEDGQDVVSEVRKLAVIADAVQG